MAFWPVVPSMDHQDFVRRGGIDLAEHAADLAELVHQPGLGMQAAGGVGDQHIGAARLGGLQRVERHRSGIGVLSLRDHGHAIAIAPGLQLRHRGSTEGVAGCQHQAAAVVLEALGELADGGGLADAVDANGKHHERFERAVDHQRLGDRLQQRDEVGAQGLEQRLGIDEFARFHPLAQAVDQRGSGADADVGGDQRSFDLVEQVVVELGVTREQAAKAACEGAVA
ncbi:UNVERIFIED_ORG: hypothetical protein ABIB63_000112 [Xanthomonas axonopodis]